MSPPAGGGAAETSRGQRRLAGWLLGLVVVGVLLAVFGGVGSGGAPDLRTTQPEGHRAGVAVSASGESLSSDSAATGEGVRSPVELPSDPGASVDPLQARLEQGGANRRLLIEVVDGAEQAVGGVRVRLAKRLVVPRSEHGDPWRLPFAELVTDSAGEVAVAGLARGSYEVSLDRDGRGGGQYTVSVDDTENRVSLVFRLEPEVAVSVEVWEEGRLVDPDSLTVDPAQIRLERLGAGRYRYVGPWLGFWVLARRGDVLAMGRVERFASASDGGALRLELVAGGSLVVRFTGENIPRGASLAIMRGSFREASPIIDGEAGFSGLAPGRYVFELQDASAVALARIDGRFPAAAVASGAEVRTALEVVRGGALTGVASLDAGALVGGPVRLIPVVDPEVGGDGLSTHFLAGPLELSTFAWASVRATRATYTDADGHYAFRGLEPGRYRVLVLPEVACFDVRDIEVAEGETVELEHRLDDGCWLEGHVWAQAIRLEPALGEGRPIVLAAVGDGAFGARSVPQRRYGVFAVRGEDSVGLGELDLRGVRRQVVDFRDEGRFDLEIHTWLGARVRWMGRNGEADASGVVRFESLFEPRSNDVIVVDSDRSTAVFRVIRWEDRGRSFRIDLARRRGVLRLVSEGDRTPKGIAWSMVGKEVGGDSQLLRASGELVGDVLAGSPQNIAVPLGQVLVRAEYQDAPDFEKLVTVETEEVEVLAVRPETEPAGVQVRVTDRLAAPCSDVLVRLFDLAGEPLGSVEVTNSEGFAMLRGPAGESAQVRVVGGRGIRMIRALQPLKGRLPFQELVLPAAGQESGIGLQLDIQ